ncbi:hypothetical protein [Prevotella fusca]
MKQERTIRRAWNKGIRLPYALMDSYLWPESYQGTDFDVQIADNTLCMMTHMLLTLEKRFSEHQTMGNLFQEERESLLRTTLRKRILSIIERLLAALAEHLMIDIFGTMDRLAGGQYGNGEDGSHREPVDRRICKNGLTNFDTMLNQRFRAYMLSIICLKWYNITSGKL